MTTYQEKAMETAIYPNIGNNYNYPYKGLVNEYMEMLLHVWQHQNGGQLNEVELAKEIGDVYWYCAVLTEELGMLLPTKLVAMEYRNIADVERWGLASIGNIGGHLKKMERDGVDKKDLVQKEMGMLLTVLANFIQNLTPYTVDDVLEMNLTKLADRQKRDVITGDGDNR